MSDLFCLIVMIVTAFVVYRLLLTRARIKRMDMMIDMLNDHQLVPDDGKKGTT